MKFNLFDPDRDQEFMQLALLEALKAKEISEIPVGAVLVHQGIPIAKAHNRREIEQNPISHAEMLVLKDGAQRLNRWRLSDCTLYVTLEPCPMCAGALVMARIGRLVYGATDYKAGAVESLFNIPGHPNLNHRVQVTAGVEEESCRKILQEFFQERRKN